MTPYYSDSLVTIYHGDAFELLPELRVKADALVTDPPFVYSVANVSNNYLTPRKEHGNSWSEADVMGRWFATALDVAMPRLSERGSLLAFCSPTSYPVFFPHAFRRFDKVTGVVWDKGRIGTGQRWRRQFEMLMYAYQEGAYWNEQHDLSDVVRVRPSASGDRPHPVDKPVELMAYVMGPVVPPAGLVLDPFLGGGATIVAAKALGLRAIGIEAEEKWCEVAAQRCSQEVLGLAV